MSTRTFTLTSPHMTGDDVKAFQRDLSERFAELGDRPRGRRRRRLRLGHPPCRPTGMPGARARQRDRARRHARVAPQDPRPRPAHGGRGRALEERRDQGLPDQAPAQVRVTGDDRRGREPAGRAARAADARRTSRASRAAATARSWSRRATNHKKFSRPGVVSDHFTGHAVDLGMIRNHGTNDGPVGDVIMAAALVEAGLTRADAIGQGQGGRAVHAGPRRAPDPVHLEGAGPPRPRAHRRPPGVTSRLGRVSVRRPWRTRARPRRTIRSLVGWTMLYLFVFLKLPIVAACWIVWWAVKQGTDTDDVRARRRVARARAARTRARAVRARRAAAVRCAAPASRARRRASAR